MKLHLAIRKVRRGGRKGSTKAYTVLKSSGTSKTQSSVESRYGSLKSLLTGKLGVTEDVLIGLTVRDRQDTLTSDPDHLSTRQEYDQGRVEPRVTVTLEHS